MISDKIRGDLTAAMRAGDTLRVSVLRMALSALNYKRIELGRDLEEADEQGVLANEAKKRREAIESYTAGGRTEQAESERQELAILWEYLPKQMSETEVEKEIRMKVVSPMFKGRADGGLVAKVVREVVGG